ncbi:hypothetical protein BP6252_02809 [Coleophoma cylindrospora]|uniref:Uncharacterized protein n=1 Tax=Coleophoma cylindrospora TaxID=1849047 RepID=A0A3D8SFV7_9HELO|nr:hypothetical protein BP6252_02809 [Coleophoma cylindrospora]
MSNMDDRVRTALATYSSRMRASNLKFLHERISEIETRSLPSERDRLDRFARVWHHTAHWPQPGERVWNPHAPTALVEQAHREEAITSLAAAKTLQHWLMNGVIEPSLADADCRRVFVEEFEQVVNGQITAHSQGRCSTLRANKELKSFLKLADGVADPNFRASGMCAWQVVPPGTGKAQDLDALRNDLAASFVHDFVSANDDLLEEFCDELDIMGGFQVGEAARDEDFLWYSYYLFCRRAGSDDDDGKEEDSRGWCWRVAFLCTSDAAWNLDSPPLVFDSILEFLD